MARTGHRRSAVAGAALGAGATLALVLGLGALATTGTAAPPPKPENTSPPTISGTPREGATLTGNRGQWTNSPTDYNFSWQRCDQNGGSCSAISGATRSTYALKKVDVGNTIRFRVEAVNGGGSTFASSVPTAVIAPAQQPPPPPPATGCPSGSGTIQIGNVSPPARLLIDAQQANPTVVVRGTLLALPWLIQLFADAINHALLMSRTGERSARGAAVCALERVGAISESRRYGRRWTHVPPASRRHRAAPRRDGAPARAGRGARPTDVMIAPCRR